MKTIGRISLTVAVLGILAGVVVLTVLPFFFKLYLVTLNTGILILLALEALTFLLGLIAFRTRPGKFAVLISLLVIGLCVVYFVMARESMIEVIKDSVREVKTKMQ